VQELEAQKASLHSAPPAPPKSGVDPQVALGGHEKRLDFWVISLEI
jgi:hypothetical protein